MTPLRTSLTALLVLSFAVPALAQVPDYSGAWALEASLLIPGEASPCLFTGNVFLEQMGTTLTGDAVLVLTSGPAACPPLMMAMVSGEIAEMDCVSLGALSGPLGTAFFSGCPGNQAGSLAGDVVVETGPFAGTGGTWSAAQGNGAISVPTLSEVGLAALAVLMLVAGAWVMRRRAQVV